MENSNFRVSAENENRKCLFSLVSKQKTLINDFYFSKCVHPGLVYQKTAQLFPYDVEFIAMLLSR
jgi:hypothetical protein